MIAISPDIRGLVFDLDGTLADTMALHYCAWSQALREHDCEFPEPLFYEFSGMPTRSIARTLRDRHGYKIPPEKVACRKEALFREMIPQTRPIEPVVQVVREFSGRLPMAVATGGTRDICTRTLAALGLVERFAAIVTSEDVLHGKPAPDIFLEAARRMGVVPATCCVFEDGDLGIQAAHTAGMQVVDVRAL